MKKIIGLILIVAGIALGVMGFGQVSDSQNSVGIIGDLEISVDNEKGKTNGFIMIGAGVVALIGGVYLVKGKG